MKNILLKSILVFFHFVYWQRKYFSLLQIPKSQQKILISMTFLSSKEVKSWGKCLCGVKKYVDLLFKVSNKWIDQEKKQINTYTLSHSIVISF